MPSLPFELERLIFEIAALQDINHNHRIQITLVAKRVYEWIRPILYRVVVFRDDLAGAFTIHNWPNAQITNSARFVRHLYLSTSFDQMSQMISTFPNIENFGCWGFTPISWEGFKILNDLPLRRLSLYLGMTSLHQAIKHCPVFKNLTHLEHLHMNRNHDMKALRELPNLTHLSFFFYGYVTDAVVLDLLKHCASFRVLICFAMEGGGWNKAIELDGPRFLFLHFESTVTDLMEEWARSANGLIGRWELAEVIIDARKANLFKDTAPSILSQKTWMEHLNDDGLQWYEEWLRGIRDGGESLRKIPR